MSKKHSIHCINCGADVAFKPGTTSLVCEYCGTENEIPLTQFELKGSDLNDYLKLDYEKKTIEVETVICPGCGAHETMDEDKSSSFCAYCGTPLVSGKTQAEEILTPDYLLPFKLDKKEALEKTSLWLRGNWFVPGKLKKDAISYAHFKGVYVPYWTYDAQTSTHYTGQRGDTYYEEVRRGDKIQRIPRTRWSPVFGGNISYFFDDVLIPATTNLQKQHLERLAPWDLGNLVPFDDDFLRGFITEKFKIGLKDGFLRARTQMEASLSQMIRREIGGDQQRIISQNTRYDNLTFKHILLPVYVSSFLYKGKKYQFIVNSRTGEVQGEKPLSKGKIALVVIVVLIIVLLFFFLTQR